MSGDKQPCVYLASASPRRRELLDQIGVAYAVLPADVPEVRRDGEPPEVFVLRLALAKARAALERRRLPLAVLGADTVVVAEDGGVLGKPRDRATGLAMLDRLAGRSHHVLTGVALADGEREASRLSVSTVTFRPIGAEEAVDYWESGEPADKAGAYAIQGRGAIFVARLEGSYSGVMGLPLFETAELLRLFDIPVGRAVPRPSGKEHDEAGRE